MTIVHALSLIDSCFSDLEYTSRGGIFDTPCPVLHENILPPTRLGQKVLMVNWDVTKGLVSVELCAVLLPTLQCVQHRLTAQIVDHRSGATKLLRLHSVSPKWRFQVFD